MANSRYDQLPVVINGAQWEGGRILAFLVKGASFIGTHKFYSDVKTAGATQVNVAEIFNKHLGPAGEALGPPATFNVTPKGGPYQIILCYDTGMADFPVLVYYDRDAADAAINLANNATFVFKPEDLVPATGLGTWFSF